MIHNTLGEKVIIIGTTLESRINSTHDLTFLVKLENEFSGKIVYAYGQNQVVNRRYTKLELPYNTTSNVFTGEVNLIPVGYWKYEIYEVSFEAGVPNIMDETNSPKTEVTVLAVSAENGIVNGQVDSGKLHVHQPEGVEEDTYIKLDGVSDNYIYPYGDVETGVNQGGDKHYTHIQIQSIMVWNITHNLKKFPSVSVVDSAGSKVTGEVDYIDINTVRLTFTAEFGGEAYLN